MVNQSFDALTRLAAQAPDRRNMLKLVGAAAVAGVAGAVSRSEEAEAGLITAVVIVSKSFNDFVDIEVKNNNIALQVCAVVDVLSAELLGDDLTCTIEQHNTSA
jgi:hypothetical protein